MKNYEKNKKAITIKVSWFRECLDYRAIKKVIIHRSNNNRQNRGYKRIRKSSGI
jgi:hypothetical protein